MKLITKSKPNKISKVSSILSEVFLLSKSESSRKQTVNGVIIPVKIKSMTKIKFQEIITESSG